LALAVLIPCFNEAATIGRVVRDFRRELPEAAILVFDNNSSDGSARIARQEGARVVRSPLQGKGNVVRHMFDVVDADVYVIVDGDDTYPAEAARDLIETLQREGADMVVGTRLSAFELGSFRRFHLWGNHIISALISRLFRVEVTDVLSGYRAISREFATTVPLSARGFEIETELTLQAAAKRFPVAERPIAYRSRSAGSESKLNTFGDGYIILKAIFRIFRDFKPLLFFCGLSVAFALLSLGVGAVPILDYYDDYFIEHVPLAILATGLGILAVIFMGIGLILDTVSRYHAETFQLFRKTRRRRTFP
jgi:glycosyltransferase involved in cell wall biosynthesis